MLRKSVCMLLVVLGACAKSTTPSERAEVAASEFAQAKELTQRVNTAGVSVEVCQDAINQLQGLAYLASDAVRDTTSTNKGLAEISHAFTATAYIVSRCSKNEKVMADVINASTNPSRRRELAAMADAIELSRVFQ